MTDYKLLVVDTKCASETKYIDVDKVAVFVLGKSLARFVFIITDGIFHQLVDLYQIPPAQRFQATKVEAYIVELVDELKRLDLIEEEEDNA